MKKVFVSDDYNLDINGKTDSTIVLQQLIDEVSNCNGKLIIKKGIYLITPLFFKSNMEVDFEEGVVFKALIDESLYKDIYTRVAGIEMYWYPGLINIIDANNVAFHGKCIIDGQGNYYYKKYWGEDQKSGMRAIYDQKGLRFACDYDCKRVRNLLISNSYNININDLISKDSGFWNIHVLYSHDITLNNIVVNSDSSISPSTDGIDIDSSYNVVIRNCVTNCNDDSIVIKSGRDSDGLKVNKPSHDILIENCTLNKGYGITLGSEVSGGIYNVNIHNVVFNYTSCAFRIKSSKSRKGYIKNIQMENAHMKNVSYLFHLYTNWNPSYCNCELENQDNLPEHYYKLLKPVDDNIKNTEIKDLLFKNISSCYDSNYKGINRIFNILGFDDSHIKNVIFENMDINAKEYGYMKNIDNVKIINSSLIYEIEHDFNNDEFDNR